MERTEEDRKGGKKEQLVFEAGEAPILDLSDVSNLELGLTSSFFLPTDEVYGTECADLSRHDPSAAPFSPCCCCLLPRNVKNPLRAGLRQTPGGPHR